MLTPAVIIWNFITAMVPARFRTVTVPWGVGGVSYEPLPLQRLISIVTEPRLRYGQFARE